MIIKSKNITTEADASKKRIVEKNTYRCDYCKYEFEQTVSRKGKQSDMVDCPHCGNHLPTWK